MELPLKIMYNTHPVTIQSFPCIHCYHNLHIGSYRLKSQHTQFLHCFSPKYWFIPLWRFTDSPGMTKMEIPTQILLTCICNILVLSTLRMWIVHWYGYFLYSISGTIITHFTNGCMITVGTRLANWCNLSPSCNPPP